MTNSNPTAASWPEKAAICLLAMPACLFFATWFRPLVGIPAAAAAVWTAWRLARSVDPSPLPSRAALAQIAVVALCLTWTAGFGGLFHQVWDHNLSNALLRDLINNSWPVAWSTPEGTVVLDHSLAWSLLPALVGKILGWRAATWASGFVALSGAFLAILLFVRVAGAWRWWIPFVLVLWSGLDVVGCGLRGMFPGYGINMDLWSYPLWYLSHLVGFYSVSHLVVPTWLAMLLIVGRKVGPRGVAGLCAFLVPLAPYSAVGCAPFALWGMLQGAPIPSRRIRSLLTPENIVAPLAFLAVCAPYFLGNREIGVDSRWFWRIPPPPTSTTWIKYAAFWLLEILVPAAAVLACGVRDRLFALGVVVLCLLPLWSSGSENDWSIYASLPGLLVLSLCTARALLEAPRSPARWFLVGVFSVGAFSPAHELWQSTLATFAKDAHLEADDFRTYDPALLPAAPWERNLLVAFHSRPLEELPILRRMLAPARPSSAPTGTGRAASAPRQPGT